MPDSPAPQTWTLMQPATTQWPQAKPPDKTWSLPGGTAWVYYATGTSDLTRPVILADGFSDNPRKSSLDELWDGLEGSGQAGKYRFISGLRDRGCDVVILGYDDRTAAIQDNARVATECILRARAERRGDAPLAVGGFSMGGLVTRYALAKLERERMQHETAVYFSYDSPHRGAWMPISVQALAHFTGSPASATINSPAARQLLRYHIQTVDDPDQGQDALRTQFLAELERLGGWPQLPRKVGVANGTGTGAANGVPDAATALECTGTLHAYDGTRLYTQATGANRLVATLDAARVESVYTNNIPNLDGAPGGTLEMFGLARDGIAAVIQGGQTVANWRSSCFVPSVSAVAIADIDTAEQVYANIGDMGLPATELDDFMCATTNGPHTLMTEELGKWLLDQIGIAW